MLKTLMMAILVAGLPLLLAINEATGAAEGPHSGYCPAGTCADNGGPFADNVNNCRKENCGRGQGAAR